MDAVLFKHLAGFAKQPGGSTVEAEKQLSASGVELPADYWAVMRSANGSEGFLGDEYLRFYPADQLITLNDVYCSQEFIPGQFIFGSNGGGSAWAFDLRVQPAIVVKVPFIPMLNQLGQRFGSFEQFLTKLAGASAQHDTRRVNPALIGKEVHEIQPIVFGGDPVANDNKAYLSPSEYAPYVVWWNRKYRELVRGQ